MSASGNGLTRRLAAHVVSARYEDLPAEAVHAAKRSLLDAIGVSLAASALGEGCAAFAEEARALGGAPQSTVLGFGFRAPAVAAALANGALAHALDFEDAYDGAPCHPNAPMIPAALAIMEARGGVSGKDLIAALAIGCDLVCRLSLALTENPDIYGFYPPPILGAFGAAAAAGRIAGLNADQMVDAFALTLSQSIASAQFKETPDSMVRAVRDAFAAQAGLLAVNLAARGVRGYEGALEGKAGLYALYARGAYDADIVTRDLGQRFLGADVSFKPWPACRGTHSFIEAALDLRAAHKLAPGDIERIEMIGAPMMTMLAEPLASKKAPQTAIDAKFSLPFTVATALVHADVTLAHFAPRALADGAVLALTQRAAFRAEANGAGGNLAVTRGHLMLRLKDGRTLEKTIDHPRGHPTNPLSDADLQAKFHACAALALQPAPLAACEAFVACVYDLENIANTRDLLAGF